MTAVSFWIGIFTAGAITCILGVPVEKPYTFAIGLALMVVGGLTAAALNG